ncbi:hypothetical protein ACTWPB_20435 [Nocardia sp. IBHARD005]|uniref:hypothetical protein n=1 Tax=Nocardia sp. IBHARD005 TaxID=3457765 RepID=UPI0040590A85
MGAHAGEKGPISNPGAAELRVPTAFCPADSRIFDAEPGERDEFESMLDCRYFVTNKNGGSAIVGGHPHQTLVQFE